MKEFSVFITFDIPSNSRLLAKQIDMKPLHVNYQFIICFQEYGKTLGKVDKLAT